MNGTLAMPNSASPAASFSDPGPPYLPKDQIRPGDHPADEARRDACIPDPPGAPRFPRPQRAGHERQQPEEHRHLRRASAVRSCRASPVARKRTLAMPQTMLAPRNIQAEGMW